MVRPSKPNPDPACMQCKEFRITWNPEQPRACRAYGFQSREFPSALVRRFSGIACQQFAPRDRASFDRPAKRSRRSR